MEDLTAQNPNVTPEDRKRVEHNIVAFRMANNRRVDVGLSTTGQTSQRFFPYNSDDLNVLLGEQKPVAKKAVDQESPRQEVTLRRTYCRGRVGGPGADPLYRECALPVHPRAIHRGPAVAATCA